MYKQPQISAIRQQHMRVGVCYYKPTTDIISGQIKSCVRQPVSKKTEFPATEVLPVCDRGLGLDRDNHIHFAEDPKNII